MYVSGIEIRGARMRRLPRRASQSKSYLHFVSWATGPRVVVDVSIIPNVTVVLILVLK